MKKKHLRILENLNYAFQPIVHSHNGKIYGVEALLRNFENIENINNADELFNYLYEEDILYEFDLLLRQKAIKKFTQINCENLKLFYNLDNRVILDKNYKGGNTQKILEENNLTKHTLCIELSEKGTIKEQDSISKMIRNYRDRDYCIAIDDFGIGVSGLKMLYHSEADIIKLDRFFITNIDVDTKKRHFCNSIIDMAHIMGIKVVAEGVETVNEFYTCYEIGADFIQGFLVQKATLNTNEILNKYELISNIIKNNKRESSTSIIDKKYIEKIEALSINSSLEELFLHFKDNSKNSFVPIVDEYETLLGVIYENDIKKLSYSKYGLSLAKNQNITSNLKKYIKSILSVDISWGIDKTLETFSLNSQNDLGIFITKADKYKGYINLNSLLTLSYNRNIEIASNQNPLTKLPGNNQIDNFLVLSLEKKELAHIVYFDFDNFKPFNDYYGFRQGDRAILMFSQLLQKKYPKDSFIAHIGGDDFFIGLKNHDFNKVYEITNNIVNEFREDAKNLYNEKDKSKGFIITKDRFNETRKFDFLSVSSVIIEINKYSKKENFDHIIGILKKNSKKLKSPIYASI